MTTTEINAHVAANRRTFKVSFHGGTVKAEVLETGLSGRGMNRNMSGVRVKLRDGTTKKVESRDIVSLWTDRDEERHKNREQALAIMDRITGELLDKEVIDPTVRINSSGDDSMRNLVIGFSGRDAIRVLDLLDINSDISYEQKV